MTITLQGTIKLSPNHAQLYPFSLQATVNTNKQIISPQLIRQLLLPNYRPLFSAYWKTIYNRYMKERPLLCLYLLSQLLPRLNHLWLKCMVFFNPDIQNPAFQKKYYTQAEINNNPQLQELVRWMNELKSQFGITDPIFLGYRERAEGEECNEEAVCLSGNMICIEKAYLSDEMMMSYIKNSIAHELAHYKFKHALRRSLRAKAVIVIDALVLAIAYYKRSPLYLGILLTLDIAAMHFELFFSRRDEIEADREANTQLRKINSPRLMSYGRVINWLKLPDKCYKNWQVQLTSFENSMHLSPQECISFQAQLLSTFRILWGAEIEKRLHYPPWLSTHPPHAERILLDGEN
ncbi:MAG: M48 family metalloprotease [Simkania negevensis]|nr:M48 family metalloprotease [Simkania negevensis]